VSPATSGRAAAAALKGGSCDTITYTTTDTGWGHFRPSRRGQRGLSFRVARTPTEEAATLATA
jgi:hypothetical protein